MRRDVEAKVNSSIYSKIEASQLSEHESQLTRDATHHADLFADSVLWTLEKIEHLFGSKPETKH